MSDYLTETKLWNSDGAEGIVVVTSDFQVVVAGHTLDVNGICGLATLTLARNPDTLLPKKELLSYVEELELPYDPLQEGSSLNRKSNITRGVNAFRKALRNPFSKNVLLLGGSGSPEQCWYLATDLRDADLVVENVSRQVIDGEMPQADAIVNSVKSMLKREQLELKHTPVRSRVAHPGEVVDQAKGIMPLREATKEENDALFQLIAYGGVPGSEITKSEIDAWIRARKIGRMETEKIIGIARGIGAIEPDARPPETSGGQAEIVYIRRDV